MSNTHTTKSIQLAIIQAFIALWEIKIEQMVAIWNFMSEDEDRLKFMKISIIKTLNHTWKIDWKLMNWIN